MLFTVLITNRAYFPEQRKPAGLQPRRRMFYSPYELNI